MVRFIFLFKIVLKKFECSKKRRRKVVDNYIYTWQEAPKHLFGVYSYTMTTDITVNSRRNLQDTYNTIKDLVI